MNQGQPAVPVTGARPSAWVDSPPFVVSLAVAMNLAVVAMLENFPYADATNHMARYVLIHDAIFGLDGPGSAVEFRWLPTAYIAIDIVGAFLVHYISPERVLLLLTLAALTILPLGMYKVLGSFSPACRILATAAAALSFNWYLLYGFINYMIGVGGALYVYGWWRGVDFKHPHAAPAILAVSGVLLFTIHMSAALILVGMLAVDVSADLVGRWLRERRVTWHALPVARLLSVVVLVVCIAGVWMAGRRPPNPDQFTGALFRDWQSKALHLATPFYSFSAIEAVLLWLALLAPIVMLVLRRSVAPGINAATLLGPAFFVVYMICPAGIFAAFDVDVRFLLPAYLLLFLIPLKSLERNTLRQVSMILVAATFLHAGYVYHIGQMIDRDLNDYRQALGTIPDGEAVLPLVADGNKYGRIDPYRHYALLRYVDRKGSAPGLFSGEYYSHFAHFRVRNVMYSPGESWGTKEFSPLDWERIRGEYPWIILAGTDMRVLAAVERNAALVERFGETAIFTTRP